MIQNLLQLTIDKKASDLHLIAGYPASIRVDGELYLANNDKLSNEKIEDLFYPLLTTAQKKQLTENRELDLGYTFGEGRFRINAYYQKGTLAIAFRLIPVKILSIDELNLPPICHSLANLKQGFVLVTGPTGHGKSTTIASMIEEVNQKNGGHILTIEDPIEYIYSPAKALVSQREIDNDTFSWSNALKGALREDPNTVLVGEMRDFETIAAALTVAETGHLVFSTLHTNSAAQSIDRIVDVFPEESKAQARLQLANTLEAVISQRLLPAMGGGRVPAVEVLIATPAVRSVIREGKTHLIDNIIQTSADLGMLTLDMSLARLVREGKVNSDIAMQYSSSTEDLERLIHK